VRGGRDENGPVSDDTGRRSSVFIQMSIKQLVFKFLTSITIAILMFVAAPADWLTAPADANALRPAAAASAPPAGRPVLDPPTAPVMAGANLVLSGSGFTSGSMVNFFVSTAKGAVNEGPIKPTVATSTALTLSVSPAIPLGQGVVVLQVVNTDQS